MSSSLTKRYGDTIAVDNPSFEARAGRILGLLGPNGVGNTSIIRMIAHITAPDQGEILSEGRAVGAWSQERMGYLPEERGLYKKLKVADQLRYFAELKGVSRSDAATKITHWLARFSLSAWAGKRRRRSPKGCSRRCSLLRRSCTSPAS